MLLLLLCMLLGRRRCLPQIGTGEKEYIVKVFTYRDDCYTCVCVFLTYCKTLMCRGKPLAVYYRSFKEEGKTKV